MRLNSHEDVLAHALHELVLLETELAYATADAADAVDSPALQACLDRCTMSAVDRVERLDQILMQLGRSVDPGAFEGGGSDAAPGTDWSGPLHMQPSRAIDADSTPAALDIAVLTTTRRFLASAQRLYADTAVNAMRWNRTPIARTIARSINETTPLLERLEELSSEIAPALAPQTAESPVEPPATPPIGPWFGSIPAPRRTRSIRPPRPTD
ncbi:MAG: hypothetical protein AAGF47_09660 [Planctomycetota bacterium]